MEHFAGLDVSVKETSVCIVDDTGKIVREVKVASEPAASAGGVENPAYHFKRIGLEAGPLSQWLYSALAEAGMPVICVETRTYRATVDVPARFRKSKSVGAVFGLTCAKYQSGEVDWEKRRCRMQNCSRSVRRTMSSGSINAARSGKFSTSSLMRASNLTVPTMPTLRPKLRKVPRKSLSMAIAFDCSSLRCVSSIRSFWLRNVFTCTGR